MAYSRSSITSHIGTSTPAYIRFTKKDGTSRTCIATYDAKYIPADQLPKSLANKDVEKLSLVEAIDRGQLEKAEEHKLPNPAIVKFFAIETNAWRSVRVDSVDECREATAMEVAQAMIAQERITKGLKPSSMDA